MKKFILLVGLDLEPFQGLAEQMPGGHEEWAFSFAATAREAFAFLEAGPFDAAVVDVALPDMDGTRVLEQIKQAQPRMLRIEYLPASPVLARTKYWETSHHLLVKPCTPRILSDLLTRSFAFVQWLPGRTTRGLISDLQMIPSPPTLYTKLIRELESPTGSMETVGQLISEDPAMTAKVLQLANSAAFGLQQTVSDAGTAVMYLGVETVKSLILLAHTFSYFEHLKLASFSMQALWNHSFATARLARRIAEEESQRGEAKAKAYTAGMLHDLGKLVMAANLSGPFTLAIKLARENHIPEWRIERGIMGASHSEIGAALLSLWGVPNDIVEAVAWHHEPTRSSDESFSPLTAVHAANVLAHELRPDDQGLTVQPVDEEYLKKLGLEDRLPAWREACKGD